MESSLATLQDQLRESAGGLQGSMTGLAHRLTLLEAVGAGGPAQSACVATREGANLPGLPHGGMDAWCVENCARGKCPERLCSCRTPGVTGL